MSVKNKDHPCTCLVSIVVPVFQVERLLHRCLDSILSQIFIDFELILIDDGSSDRGALICDEYAKKNSRVSVIHKKNSGAASARNVGIRTAQGQYLAFCDADDMVSVEWIKRLIDYADVDTLPIGSYCTCVEQLGKRKELCIEPGRRYALSDYWMFCESGISGYLWNALYERTIIEKHGIQLREQPQLGDYNEDLLFSIQYVSHIKHIVYTGYTDYLYDAREGSLSNDSAYIFEKYEEKLRIIRHFYQDNCPEPDEKIQRISSRMLFYFLVSLRIRCNSLREIRKIVSSEEVQMCLKKADAKNENPLELELISNKSVVGLKLFYFLNDIRHTLKRLMIRR